jgi:PKD repeat protein
VYAVSLTVTGPGGTDTASQNVTVNPPAPVASFTAEPPSGTVPLTVFFSNTSTGLVDSVAWDLDADGVFDDGTGPTATQTFDAAGNHTVGLSVTGPGGTSTVTKVISATLPPPPVASFTAVPTSGVAPLTVQFSDTSTGDITERSWDFNGDGTTDNTAATPSHVFDAPGSYEVALTVSGPGGDNTTSQTITVNVPPPVASFTATPITGTAPLTVQLTDTSSGAITSRAWTDGNRTISGPGVPLSFTWRFEEAGTYPVTLTVNGPGGTDTATRTIEVIAPNTAPTLEIAAPANGASFPALTNVTFAGTANDAEDGNISSSIQWSSSTDGVLGTGASISKGDLSSGAHTITASVSDSDGAPATAQITITITAPAATTTTTTTPPTPPTLPDPPGDCGGRRCEPRDPGDDPRDPGDGPPDRR